MDIAAAIWAFGPVGAFHWVFRRFPGFLPMQLLANLALGLTVIWPMLTGALPGPGLAGEERWGAPKHVAGSPEQSDMPLQFHVWWEEVRRLARVGEPPWISDRIGGGIPLLANGQTGIPFPLHLPVWVLGPERGTAVMVVWKLQLGLVGMYLLLARLRLRTQAAALGALTYAFGSYSLAWLVQPMAWVAAGAPWAWWLLLGALRGSRKAAAGLALLLGILAGWSSHPESAAFLWLAVALSGSVLALGRRRRFVRLLAPLALALPVAVGLSLPVLAAIGDSTKLAEARGEILYPTPGADGGMRLRAIALVVAPWREGRPADGNWRLPFPAAALSMGVGTLPLCLLLAARPRRRLWRPAVAFGASGAAAAILVWQAPGVTMLLARLPVLGTMVWVRSGFLVGLALALAGAMAFDAWLRRPRRRPLIGSSLFWLVLAGLLVATGHPATRRPGAALLAAPAALGTVALVAPQAVPIAAPFIAAMEAAGQNRLLLGWSRPARASSVIAVVEREHDPGEAGRVLGYRLAMPANLPARSGLADIRSHDPVRPRALGRLHTALGCEGYDLPGPVTRPWAGLAGAWGVGVLVAGPEGLNVEIAAGWEEAWQGPGGRVYRNQREQPILRLAGEAVSPPGDPAAGSWEPVDFGRAAVVENPPELGGTGSIRVIRRQPWRWLTEAESQGRTLAVLHVPRAPGWRVRVDGEQRPMVEANLGAMGVVLDHGVHRVEWRYHPPGLIPGIAITILGLLACAGWALAPAGGRRRRLTPVQELPDSSHRQ